MPEFETVHEGEPVGLDADGKQNRGGLRPLDGKQNSVERRDDHVKIPGELTQVRLVGGRIASIGHDHKVVRGEARDDQVVDDASLVGQQERIFGLRELSATGLKRTGAVEQRPGPGTGYVEQLHVQDVEEADMLARVKVLLHHAGRIGQRHRPAGKGAETRAGRLVQIFEWE